VNILADESVDQPIVNRLREDGHTVLYVAEMALVFLMKWYSMKQTEENFYY